MSKDYAILASGCFWCTETIFDNVAGVISVLPGYIGGKIPNPKYEEICTGTTGHAEAVKIEYDTNIISFSKLLLYPNKIALHQRKSWSFFCP